MDIQLSSATLHSEEKLRRNRRRGATVAEVVPWPRSSSRAADSSSNPMPAGDIDTQHSS